MFFFKLTLILGSVDSAPVDFSEIETEIKIFFMKYNFLQTDYCYQECLSKFVY
jgi:hypothetical protein